MSQRKTAEEILKKHLCYGNPHSKQDHLGGSIEQYVFLPHLKGAIQEYAKQEVEARDELIKEMVEKLKILKENLRSMKGKRALSNTENQCVATINFLLLKAQSFNQE